MKFFKFQSPIVNDEFEEIKQLAYDDVATDSPDHADAYFTMRFGLPPVLAPDRSMEDENNLKNSDTTRLDKLNADLEAIEDELDSHWPFWLLTTLFILVILVEVEASILLWAAQGATGITRPVMALATACTSIYLPYLAIESAKSLRTTYEPTDHQN